MSQGRPPLVIRIAAAVLPRADRELLLADLEAAYDARCAAGSRLSASLSLLLESLHAAIVRRRRVDQTPQTPRGSLMISETFTQDLRVGIRGLAKRPGFTLAALFTLALGIGANAAVFSVVNGILLAPLPYREAERVAVIWSTWIAFEKTWVSDAEILDYKNRMQSFQDVGGWSVGRVNLTGDGEALRVGTGFITPNLLPVLGAEPMMGRAFTEAEALPDTSTVAILSHGLWQQRYAGRPDIIGQPIQVNGIAREVIGVMPPEFQLPTDFVQDAEEPTRLWLPLRLNPQNRGSHGYHAAGRLKPGVSIEGVNAELASLAQTLTKAGQYPEAMKFSAFAVRATDEAYGDARTAILLLVGAVGCLMLIACANVANLLLVRADTRSREMAVRAALGAKRWRLVRQMLTESAALAIGAAVVGVGMAWIAMTLLLSVDLSAVPRSANITLDLNVLLFALVLTLVTLVLFSLPPALRASRVDLNDSIKEGAASTTSGTRRQRLRGLLVAGETALAVALLAGALLMIQSLWNLQRINLGLDPRNTLTMALAVPAVKYDTADKVVNFYSRLVDRVRELPGVQSAGFVRVLPLAASIGDSGMSVEGYTPPPGTGTPGDWQVVTDGAIPALGKRIVAGRDLVASDLGDAQPVALINEAMAKKYFAGREPIGARFKHGGGADISMNPNPWIAVVGVVADVRHNGITGAVKPKFYRPLAQWHLRAANASTSRNMTLVVRSSGSPLALAGPIRAEVQRMDSEVPVAAVRTMEDVVSASIATPRLTGWLLGFFAGLALLLAAIGIYSVLSYVVSQRRREIGIRVAMGASSTDVAGLVWKSGIALTAVGAVAGMVIAALGTRAISSLLHEVKPLDPLTFVAAPATLLVVASFAALVPALRATRVDPVKALRVD